MLGEIRAYSGIAVHDMSAAREFYTGALGLRTSEEYGLMWLHHPGGRDTLLYEQPAAAPASYTVLNFEVADINAAVRDLRKRGVNFIDYEGIDQDVNGIFRAEGPFIAWFTDPSGNVLSVLEERP
jgi:catechol 2,3-dioxygenase-like lactoylglutathione lyase family enzyme